MPACAYARMSHILRLQTLSSPDPAPHRSGSAVSISALSEAPTVHPQVTLSVHPGRRQRLAVSLYRRATILNMLKNANLSLVALACLDICRSSPTRHICCFFVAASFDLLSWTRASCNVGKATYSSCIHSAKGVVLLVLSRFIRISRCEHIECRLTRTAYQDKCLIVEQ